MLAVTEDAAAAIRGIISASEGSEAAGVRITTSPSTSGGAGFDLAVAAGPDAEDEVVGESDAPVFVSAEAAPLLADQVLDAQATGEGTVGFRLQRQQA